MQTQLDNAFEALNAKMLARQLAWIEARRAAVFEYYSGDERKASLGALRHTPRGKSEAVRNEDKARLEALAGGAKWLDVIFSNSTAAALAAYITKNVAALCAKRDATITKALNKAGISSIPEFVLVEYSDGVEGTFVVAGHHVTIRTILAGGYNVQCLHQRTLVKVR